MSDIKNDINNGTNQSKRIVSSLLEYVELFVFSLAIVVVVFMLFFRVCKVSGDSMNNTLTDKESLIVSNLFYKPRNGDIVVFHQTGYLNEPVVKRVIAVEGETVDIIFTDFHMMITVTDKDGNVRILDEPYAYYDSDMMAQKRYYSHPTDFSFPVTVPEGSIFVLGDNRYNSLDSRYKEVGFVDVRRILGRVVFRVSPFDKFGFVN